MFINPKRGRPKKNTTRIQNYKSILEGSTNFITASSTLNYIIFKEKLYRVSEAAIKTTQDYANETSKKRASK
jgi:hypothetical protein